MKTLKVDKSIVETEVIGSGDLIKIGEKGSDFYIEILNETKHVLRIQVIDEGEKKWDARELIEDDIFIEDEQLIIEVVKKSENGDFAAKITKIFDECWNRYVIEGKTYTFKYNDWLSQTGIDAGMGCWYINEDETEYFKETGHLGSVCTFTIFSSGFLGFEIDS